MNVTRLSASQMACMVRQKKVSPVELVAAHLDRIARLNPKLNAFVEVRDDGARRDAADAEAAVMRGEEKPLLGVPVSVKSCIDVRGLRCDAGSRLRDGYVASTDATLVARLKRAGAIILGNTNCPEMLMAYETDNSLAGHTSNPWNLARTAGGSSGGEAAAIAAGMSAAGVGSDGGGSIRVPAHFTGICGLKPTPGRIPGAGHFPPCVGPFAMMGVVGPMARTVEDLQLLLETMSGSDIGDPLAVDYPLSSPHCDGLERLRVGFFEDDGEIAVTVETKAAVRAAAKALEHAGVVVEPFLPEGLEQARQLWYTLFVRVAGGMLVQSLAQGRESEISPMLQRFLQIAAAPPPLTAEVLLSTLFERDSLYTKLLVQMEKYPVLLAPVCVTPAFHHGAGGWDDSCSVNYVRDMRYCQWFNLLRNPAVVVPVGQSPEGLPIGVQVIGTPYEESLVLKVASMIEAQQSRNVPDMAVE